MALSTRCNINSLSFLLASFDDIINTFGSTKKSIDFFRSQIENLTKIGQVDNASVEIINELINYSYITEAEKWDLELKKVEYFKLIMDVILSNAKNADEADAIVTQFENSSETKKEQKKVLGIIRKVFGIKRKIPEDLKMTGESHFGTMQFNNSVVKTGTVKNILRLAGNDAVVRVKNLEAYCSSDPDWFSYTLTKELFNNEKALKEIAKKITQGAEVNVAIRTEYGDPCRSSIRYVKNEVASIEFRKFISEYTKR